MEAQLDSELKDNEGLTAVQLADRCHHPDCAATIRRREQRVSVKQVEFTGCCFSDGPASQTLAHHWNSIDYRAAWKRTDVITCKNC